jgi:hypothetical protein
LNEEKQHLIQMLELKNSILSSFNYAESAGKPSVIQPREIFTAMQRMSQFVLNRAESNTMDETTKAIVRGVFNEQSARMLDQYERTIERIRAEMSELTRELIEANQNIIVMSEQLGKQGKLSGQLRDELEHLKAS